MRPLRASARLLSLVPLLSLLACGSGPAPSSPQVAPSAAASAAPAAPCSLDACAGRAAKVTGDDLVILDAAGKERSRTHFTTPPRLLQGTGAWWLFAVDAGGLLGAVARGDDTPRFVVGLHGSVRAATALAAGNLLALTAHGQVARLAPDGAPRWLTQVAALDRGARATTDDGGHAAVAEGKGGALVAGDDGMGGQARLIALGPDGALRWTHTGPPSSGFASASALAVYGVEPPKWATAETGTLEARPVPGAGFERFPLGDVVAVVAPKPGQAWLLRRPDRDPAGPTELLSLKDGRFVPVALPKDRANHAFDVRGLAWLPDGTLALTGYDQTLVSTGPRQSRVEASRASVLRARGANYAPAPDLLAGFPGDLGAAGLFAVTDRALCSGGACTVFEGGQWVGRAVAGFAPAAGARSDAAPAVTRVGDALWVGGARVYRASGGAFTADAAGPEDVRALWAAGPGEAWALAKDRVWHWTSGAWQSRPAPLEGLEGLGGTGPRDVWAVGRQGALRFDGERWARVPDVDGRLSLVTAASPDELWLAGVGGVYRVTRGAAAATISAPPAAPPPVVAGAAIWTPTRTETATMEHVSLRAADGGSLTRVQRVAAAADGTLWVSSETEAVEMPPSGASRPLASLVDALGATPPWSYGLAPRAAGRGWLAGPRGLLWLDGGKSVLAPHRVPATVGLAATADDTVWALGTSVEPVAPHLLVRRGDVTRFVGVPAAVYAAVAAHGDEAWLVGSLGGSPGAPRGEGLIVHVQGERATWLRVAEGPLVAISAAGPGEAWAVGPRGLVVHAAGERLEARRVDPAADLLAVWARSSGDVWLGGARGTLLHVDGAALVRVETKAVGSGDSLMSLTGNATGLWLAADSGVYRMAFAAR